MRYQNSATNGTTGAIFSLSIAALAVLGMLFVHEDLWMYSMLSFAMLGILIPFFYYNVFGKVERHEKIFMGDTGSLTLGYILAFLAIRYTSVNTEMLPYAEGAIVVAFSTLAVPMLDVLRVMFVRWRSGNGMFIADRNHIHHKLIDMGLTFHQTMVAILILACTLSLVNILLAPRLNNTILFVGDLLLWIGFNLVVNRVIEQRKKRLVLSNEYRNTVV